MKFSADKISHLSQLFRKDLENSPLANIIDPAVMIRVSKDVLSSYSNIENEVEIMVRRKIQSRAEPIAEGSREWDVLFQKYLEEELNKRW